MDRLRRRLSPSTVIATLALVAATAGTAVAAGEIITRPDQIADDTILTRHLDADAVERSDLEHPYFHVRVSSDGELLGNGNDATARRLDKGRYLVRFRDELTKAPLPLDDCAVTAQPVDVIAAPALGMLRSKSDPPGTVRIFATRTTDVGPGGTSVSFAAVDADFDMTAVC